MKRNESNITLVITIHSDILVVDFFLELLKNSHNNIIFAFDNPNISEQWRNKIEDAGFNFFVNKENTGKLRLLLNSSKKIKTKYFKIIDQDDSLSLEKLAIVNERVNKIRKDYLIKHKAFKVKSDSRYFYQSLDAKIINKQIEESIDVFYNQQTNCDTIYPTKLLKKLSKYKKILHRQDFHNDVLLSNYMIAVGTNLYELDEGFYIQFHENGQTNKINHKRSVCIFELYDNYLKLSKKIKAFDIKKTTGKQIQSHLNFIKRFTLDYPSNAKENEIIYNKTKNILEDLWKR